MLLSIQEACELTRLSRTSLYREISLGRLRTVQVGRRRLVPVRALEDWIEELEGESGALS